MLRFIAVTGDSYNRLRKKMVVSRSAIHPTLESAQEDPRAGSILVFDAASIPDNDASEVKLTISEARNGRPFRPPVAVVAAGGYVVRESPQGRELLLIFRRGVWDLPKGKLNENESIESAALREVREEVGAEHLRIIAPLGVTVHGYPEKKVYAVKTTHWFLMETSSRAFAPQLSEQIEEARWVAWSEAGSMLGFETLRDHMATLSF